MKNSERVATKAIDKDLWNIKNPVELLDQIKSLPSSGRWMEDLNTLEKILLSLSDFAAATAWALGMNGRGCSSDMGSIRLLMNVGHDATAPLTVSLLLTPAAYSASLSKSRPDAERSGNDTPKVQEVRAAIAYDT